MYNRDGDGPWKAFWLASYQLYPRRWLTQASLKDHQQQHHLGLCYNRNAIPDLPRQTLWRQSPVFCLNKPSWGCWCSLWSTTALSYCWFQPQCHQFFKKSQDWTSLVVQWLKICLPMQRTRVWSLVQEDPRCCKAAKPMCHNYCACAPASTLWNKRSHCNEETIRHKWSSLCLPAYLEKAWVQQWRPSTAKNRINFFFFLKSQD